MSDSLRCPVCKDKNGACECQIYNYRDYIEQLKDRAKKVVDLIGGPMDQKNLDILWGAIEELEKALEGKDG